MRGRWPGTGWLSCPLAAASAAYSAHDLWRQHWQRHQHSAMRLRAGGKHHMHDREFRTISCTACGAEGQEKREACKTVLCGADLSAAAVRQGRRWYPVTLSPSGCASSPVCITPSIQLFASRATADRNRCM